MPPKISEDKISRIKELKKQGLRVSEIAKIVEVSYWTANFYAVTQAKYHGIKYLQYRKNLAKLKGFSSWNDYQEFLIRNRGYKGATDYRNEMAKRKGLKSHADYQNHLAINRGFKSHSAYLKSRIINDKIKSIKEYKDLLAIRKGFKSNSEYEKRQIAKRRLRPENIEFGSYIKSSLNEIEKTPAWLCRKIQFNQSRLSAYITAKHLPPKQIQDLIKKTIEDEKFSKYADKFDEHFQSKEQWANGTRISYAEDLKMQLINVLFRYPKNNYSIQTSEIRHLEDKLANLIKNDNLQSTENLERLVLIGVRGNKSNLDLKLIEDLTGNNDQIKSIGIEHGSIKDYINLFHGNPYVLIAIMLRNNNEIKGRAAYKSIKLADRYKRYEEQAHANNIKYKAEILREMKRNESLNILGKGKQKA